MTQKIKIALLFGGRSAEHDVSLTSAAAIYRHLDKKKYSTSSIFIDKEGNWHSAASPLLSPKKLNKAAELPFMPWENEYKGRIPRPDIVFPVLHGPFGEDGTVQGACELADIPYVGSGVLSSALCMDKDMAKSLFSTQNLPVPDYLTFREQDWLVDQSLVLSKVRKKFTSPVFVKPANLGSSVGITKVKDHKGLKSALEKAFRYDRKVVVEEGIIGRELECSVLGNDHPQASLPGELIPFRDFYDYRDKYIEGKTTFIIPAKVTTQVVNKIQEIAVKAFMSLECSGMARVDFFLEDKSGRILLNEINTIPGFTEISMYPKLWEASGLPFAELLDRLVQLGMERHQTTRRKGRSRQW